MVELELLQGLLVLLLPCLGGVPGAVHRLEQLAALSWSIWVLFFFRKLHVDLPLGLGVEVGAVNVYVQHDPVILPPCSCVLRLPPVVFPAGQLREQVLEGLNRRGRCEDVVVLVLLDLLGHEPGPVVAPGLLHVHPLDGYGGLSCPLNRLAPGRLLQHLHLAVVLDLLAPGLPDLLPVERLTGDLVVVPSLVQDSYVLAEDLARAICLRCKMIMLKGKMIMLKGNMIMLKAIKWIKLPVEELLPVLICDLGAVDLEPRAAYPWCVVVVVFFVAPVVLHVEHLIELAVLVCSDALSPSAPCQLGAAHGGSACSRWVVPAWSRSVVSPDRPQAAHAGLHAPRLGLHVGVALAEHVLGHLLCQCLTYGLA